MALNEAGLKNSNIYEGSDIDSVATAVSDPNGPDIIICDVTESGDEASQVFSAIRHNELGTNPFICIIAVAWSPRQQLVSKVVNSGADLLVAAPISPSLILDRISSLVHSRKPFVVTSDYVGPDRRLTNERGEESEVPLIDVPNSLRDKALGQFDPKRIQREIEATRASINGQKIERQAHQVTYLADLITHEFSKDPENIDSRRLANLEGVVNDVKMRAFSAGMRELEELCVPLRQVVRSLIDCEGEYRKRDIELLGQLSLAVRAAVRPTGDTSGFARDISNTVIGAA